jgi:8-oxo-dGTP pyrophosphatase MutT (NUDIX family)
MANDVIRTERAERRQVAALPWRRGSDGLEILLVTSRETRRWVTPKGGRMPGLTDAEAAAVEALEEAGVEGRVGDEPLGTFRYLKVLRRRAPRWCVVSVYPLEVLTVLPVWKEQGERERLWMSAEQAAACVGEVDLAEIIRAFR